jgi:hypothetical protein
MMTWRAEPIQVTPPPPKADRRAGIVRALALAVIALVTANGVIVTEQATGRDLIDLAFGGFGGVRSAIGRALEPDPDKTSVAGKVEEQTSTTSAPRETTTTSLAAVPITAPALVAPETTTSTTTTPTTAAAVVPAANPLDQVVTQASAFVEKERGLRFRGPVKVTMLDEGPFRARLNAVRLAPAVERAKREQGVLRALGVIAPDVDLPAQVKRLSTGSMSVLYDPQANELLVRNGQVTPFVRKVIVHELVRALDDQNLELDRPNLANADDETGASFNALVEGVATRIETRYVNSLPEADRKSIEAESRRLAGQLPKDLPTYVLVSYGYPYAAGPKLADALFGAGGPARVNAALQGPPSTSEQVLHPEKFLAGEGAKAVPAPGADGAVIRQGSIGQLTLSLMLAEVLDADYAEGAADGWGGDRYVAWQNGPNTCVRLVVDMDNPDENAELADGLADWALDRPGATIEGAGPFTVTRCG